MLASQCHRRSPPVQEVIASTGSSRRAREILWPFNKGFGVLTPRKALLTLQARRLGALQIRARACPHHEFIIGTAARFDFEIRRRFVETQHRYAGQVAKRPLHDDVRAFF